MGADVVTKPWPLSGYAPGDYQCKCAICKEMFIGDKRAVMCLECAARSVKAEIETLRARVGELEGRRDQFWLEVRKPRQVPRRGGPFRRDNMAETLREWLAANPDAFVSVLGIDHEGAPSVDDAAEALQMLDGRSMSTGRRHHETSLAAHARTLSNGAALSPPLETEAASPVGEGIDAAKATLLALHKRVLAKKADHIFVIQGGDFNVFLDALLNGAIAIERAMIAARPREK